MAQMVKSLPQCGRPGFDNWVSKIPWRREWKPTPLFLPREFHGQRSLVGYSPWGRKELDMTERLTLSLSFQWLECFLPSGCEKVFQVHPIHFLAPDPESATSLSNPGFI